MDMLNFQIEQRPQSIQGVVAFIFMKSSYLNLLFICALLLFSCNEQEVSKEKHWNQKIAPKIVEKQNCYDQLILNVALSNPYYNCYKCSSKESFEWIKKLILQKKKEVKDENLGLYMALHQWTYDGGQSFPKIIIYITDSKGFEYAFPFSDEFLYYRHNYNTLSSKEFEYEFEDRMTFAVHLNYLITHLALNSPEKKKELNQFITLLTDSLLEMKEFNKQDIPNLRKYQNTKVDTSYLSKSCAKNLKTNIGKIIDDIGKENNRIFYCHTGNNSFWKMEILTNINGTLSIKPSFENEECYFSIHY